jgi:hypothetical protein
VAEPERNRVLAGECISRAQLATVTDASEAAIRAALGALDHERAALLAFARAKTEPVPVALVAEIILGIELPQIACALIAIASGERAALIEPVARRRFPISKDAAEIEALALFAAWRAGAPPARVIPEVRRLSVRSLSAEGFALIATIAAAIDDVNVRAATKHIASFAKEYAKQVASDERAMAAKLDDVIASLPAEIETAAAGGFTVRGAKQIGRNDPCPCGSGLKYKKCCADKPVATPSPIPGLSWDDFLGSGANQMLVGHVQELALRDLARVDPARLGDVALVAAYRRLMHANAWDHAERALDELARRQPDKADDWRDELVLELLSARELEHARRHVARLQPDAARVFALEFAVEDGPTAAWPALVADCQRALNGSDKLADVELAYTLLRAMPSVGIYFARACIGTLHVDDADTLLQAVEDARDELGLTPNDPAWDVLDALTDRGKQAKHDEAAELRAELQQSSARADQLERTLAAMRGELDAARTLPAVALARAPETERPSGLESRVRELEALIREGNAERRDLRQKLQSTLQSAEDDKREASARDDHRSRRVAPAAETDDAETEAVEPGARATVLPRFDRRFADAVASVPANVAAEAMRTIGALSAGDAFAWRNVKQAKDMTRQVLMARVGIHHRLLFRGEDGALDVLDLITREQLMTTLKRLRAQR